METAVRNTPLTECHIAAGARMVPFSGWNMPVQYSEGIIAEHNHTRNAVSLFDICHMGEFRINGAGARVALDHLLARPVSDQKTGICRYNFLLNPAGGVMDDLIVYCIADDEFFIVVNAGCIASDAAQFIQELPNGIDFTDESDTTAKIDLQGPLSAEVLISLGLDADRLPKYFHFNNVKIGGMSCLLSRTGYTGELGFEIYLPTAHAENMWNLLLSDSRVKPAGLGARDTLRLEMGYALYGHELNRTVTPLEAGMGSMLNLDKYPERQFIGSNALRSPASDKQLVGIMLDGRRAAREGTIISNIDGEEIGIVTSGAFSPSLGKAVAMGYISGDFNCGDKLLLNAGRKAIPGQITELPFYQSGSVRKKL
jgi:glycine cleavage system T protein (aminomethyltransferase)